LLRFVFQSPLSTLSQEEYVKKTLVAVAVVMTLTLGAMAQKAKAPVSQHRRGNPNGELKLAPAGIPPALCSPCLFYGGDIDTNDLNAAGMSDENTLLIFDGGATSYAGVAITRDVTLTGMLINVQASAAFDPQTAIYDVRSGVTDGNGGSQIATGTSNITVASTGRNFLGLNEYTVAVNFSSPVSLSAGSYWFGLQPQCTNTLDGSCSVGRLFVSNTTTGVNNVAGQAQLKRQMFLNSDFFGFTYTNWCDSALGFNTLQCGAMSFGLMGTAN
jgi:hypothetical protein